MRYSNISLGFSSISRSVKANLEEIQVSGVPCEHLVPCLHLTGRVAPQTNRWKYYPNFFHTVSRFFGLIANLGLKTPFFSRSSPHSELCSDIKAHIPPIKTLRVFTVYHDLFFFVLHRQPCRLHAISAELPLLDAFFPFIHHPTNGHTQATRPLPVPPDLQCLRPAS